MTDERARADAEQRWAGKRLAHGQLTSGLLPGPARPWTELVFFAGTFDGYTELGMDVTRLEAFADEVRRGWNRDAQLPTDLTTLRGALFAEQRRDHFTDSASDPETLHYIHALVYAIRAVVTGSESPGGANGIINSSTPGAPGAILTAPADIELKLGARTIHTVFDLLGHNEDDMTYSVGWGLAQSHAFAQRVVQAVYGKSMGALTAIGLQQADNDTGRTDIEIETEHAHLVIEAKRGWTVPQMQQLQKYADRLKRERGRDRRIVVVAEAAEHFPPVQQMLDGGPVDGIRVSYLPWSQLAALAAETSAAVKARAERALLRELNRYLRRLMTSQSVTSNMVYVVSLNHQQHDWTSLTFVQTVMEQDRYYHPVGGPGQHWPKTPPNYLGFRFDGKLQRVSHVEDYEVVTRPHDHAPWIAGWVDWSDQPHFLYQLGAPLPLPKHPVKSTKMWNRRVEVALDLLLTCDSSPTPMPRPGHVWRPPAKDRSA